MKKIFLKSAWLALLFSAVVSCHKETPPPPPPPYENYYPIANAGVDQKLTLPTDSVLLDGSASFDQDGTMAKYQWKQVSGPMGGGVIQNPVDVKTMVTHLIEGLYVFRLTVTDNKGANATDEINISVFPANCDVSNRPTITGISTEIGTLSVKRYPNVAAAGSKLIFAGGYFASNVYDAVDIYDNITHNWTTAKLSVAREGIAAAGCGNTFVFAGGDDGNQVLSDVDIYDANTNTWSVAQLSEARTFCNIVVAGTKIFIAGGYTQYENWFGPTAKSQKVDIYDVSTKQWTVRNLSEPKAVGASAALGNKVYFAGGFTSDDQPTNAVDVYDMSTNSWSMTSLQTIWGGVTGIGIGDKIYWAGNQVFGLNVEKLEIWNPSNNSIASDCLSTPAEVPTVVVRNNELAFFGNNISGMFEVFDVQTGLWRKVTNTVFQGSAIVSLNNVVYMAGYSANSKVYSVNW